MSHLNVEIKWGTHNKMGVFYCGKMDDSTKLGITINPYKMYNRNFRFNYSEKRTW